MQDTGDLFIYTRIMLYFVNSKGWILSYVQRLVVVPPGPMERGTGDLNLP